MAPIRAVKVATSISIATIITTMPTMEKRMIRFIFLLLRTMKPL